MATVKQPTIPIRINRSVKLRQRNVANSMACVPTKSEGSSYVNGQNRAAQVSLKHRLDAWFREKNFTVDKLNRYQDAAYDSFMRIEEEKKDLFYFSKQTPAFPAEHEEKEETKEDEPDKKRGKGNTTAGVLKSKSSSGSLLLPTVMDKDISPTLVKKDTTEDITLPKLIKSTSVPTTSESKRHVPLARSLSYLALSPTKYDQDAVESDVKSAAIRPAKSTTVLHMSEESDDKQQQCTNCKKVTFATEVRDLDALPKKEREVPLKQPEGEGERWRDGERKVSPKEDVLTITGRRPAMKFTSYQKDGRGNIVKTDHPYQRRSFLKPKEKDYSVLERLIRAEELKTEQSMEKYRGLTQSIDQLKDMSPLKVLQAARPPSAARIQRQSTKKMAFGQLDYLIRAFGNKKDAGLLEGLDPNSPEALRLCRYIRAKGIDPPDCMDS